MELEASVIPPLSSTDKWIQVSPKKRVQSFPVKTTEFNTQGMSPTHVQHMQSPENSNDQGSSQACTQSFNTRKIILANPVAMTPNPNSINDDPLDAIEDDTMEESPSCMGYNSQLGEFQEDDLAVTFLNLEPIQDIELSFESAKRRKVKRGMKASFRQNSNCN